MKIINFCIFLIIYTCITSCGYKVVNRNSLTSFEVSEINTTGDKRINFVLKNKILQNNSKTPEKTININLVTNKIKNIKEKNIKNQITKYELQINVKVQFNELNKSNIKEFNIVKTGDYDVQDLHSSTLKNEKNLINTLIDNLADDILDQLALKINDL